MVVDFGCKGIPLWITFLTFGAMQHFIYFRSYATLFSFSELWTFGAVRRHPTATPFEKSLLYGYDKSDSRRFLECYGCCFLFLYFLSFSISFVLLPAAAQGVPPRSTMVHHKCIKCNKEYRYKFGLNNHLARSEDCRLVSTPCGLSYKR